MKRNKRTIVYSIIFIAAAGVLYCMRGNTGSVQENLETDGTIAASQQTVEPSAMDKEPEKESEKEHKTAFCYICGAVKNPGVYPFAAGARLNELIEQAGGLTKEADVTSLNLARTVEDSEKVYVQTREEAKAEAETSKVGQHGQGDAGESDGTDAEDKVNINSADIDKLTSLPGIGEAKAKSILSYREEHGAFQSIEELKNVEGIKDGVFNKVKDLISIQ